MVSGAVWIFVNQAHVDGGAPLEWFDQCLNDNLAVRIDSWNVGKPMDFAQAFKVARVGNREVIDIGSAPGCPWP